MPNIVGNQWDYWNDFFGQEYKVDDIILYVTVSGSSPYYNIARVKAILAFNSKAEQIEIFDRWDSATNQYIKKPGAQLIVAPMYGSWRSKNKNGKVSNVRLNNLNNIIKVNWNETELAKKFGKPFDVK